MNEAKIKRINELSAIAKQRELTEAEQTERQTLRREYIDSVKSSLIGHLDNTYIMEQDGTKRPLKKSDDNEKH